jgi:hypothetical protein
VGYFTPFYLNRQNQSVQFCWQLPIVFALIKKVVDIIQKFGENVAINYCKSNPMQFFESAGELW